MTNNSFYLYWVCKYAWGRFAKKSYRSQTSSSSLRLPRLSLLHSPRALRLPLGARAHVVPGLAPPRDAHSFRHQVGDDDPEQRDEKRRGKNGERPQPVVGQAADDILRDVERGVRRQVAPSLEPGFRDERQRRSIRLVGTIRLVGDGVVRLPARLRCLCFGGPRVRLESVKRFLRSLIRSAMHTHPVVRCVYAPISSSFGKADRVLTLFAMWLGALTVTIWLQVKIP